MFDYEDEFDYEFTREDNLWKSLSLTIRYEYDYDYSDKTYSYNFEIFKDGDSKNDITDLIKAINHELYTYIKNEVDDRVESLNESLSREVV